MIDRFRMTLYFCAAVSLCNKIEMFIVWSGEACQGDSHPSNGWMDDPLWPAMIFSLLVNWHHPGFNLYNTSTLILEVGWVGGYGSLEVLGYKFLPKQSRLFDDEDAESSECRGCGGKTLLSVTQAIRACETWSPPSTPPTHTHKSLVQHCHFSPKGYFWKVSLLIRCLKIIGVW